jgi:uncharacterized protein DUF2071
MSSQQTSIPASEADYTVMLAARLVRPTARGIDVITNLRHFALVSYLVPIERLQGYVDPAFEVVPFTADGVTGGLLSVVPFLDVDFRFARLPWLRFRMGQTNYRLYVRRGDEQMAWFLGTALDSFSVVVPHYAWSLPWYRAQIRFDVLYSREEQSYLYYRMRTQSEWAAADLTLEGTNQPMPLLPGFSTLAEQQFILTNPVRGVFHRRDGRLGSYTIWHPQMRLSLGHLRHARFALLERLGILSPAESQQPHSVLLTPEVEFQISLPPHRILDLRL